MQIVATDGSKYPAHMLSGVEIRRYRRRDKRLVVAKRCVSRKEQTMLDTIFVVATLIFFAVSIGYAYACDRL
jgi:hypothetical protein